MPPHILTIPREIRDMIYDNLTQDIKYKASDEEQNDYPRITVHGYPRLSVLLVCSQFRDEYLESKPFGPLHATAHTVENCSRDRGFSLSDFRREIDKWNQRPASSFASLSRVGHLTIFDSNHVDFWFATPQSECSPSASPTFKLFTFVQQFTKLSTVKLAEIQPWLEPADEIGEVHMPPAGNERLHHLPRTPPPNLGRLRLVQYASGYIAQIYSITQMPKTNGHHPAGTFTSLNGADRLALAPNLKVSYWFRPILGCTYKLYQPGVNPKVRHLWTSLELAAAFPLQVREFDFEDEYKGDLDPRFLRLSFPIGENVEAWENRLFDDEAVVMHDKEAALRIGFQESVYPPMDKEMVETLEMMGVSKDLLLPKHG